MGEWAINDYASITGTARNEWYSVLASGSNSAFYPSIAGRIDLTRAAGMKSDNLNSAVVHAGLSRVGGAVPPLLLTNIFTPPTDSAATVSASRESQPRDHDVARGGRIAVVPAESPRLRRDALRRPNDRRHPRRGQRRPLGRRQQRRHAFEQGQWSCRPRSFRSARRRARSGPLDARLAKNSNNLDDVSSGSSAVLLGPQVYGLSVEARKGSPLGALVGSGFKRDGSGNLLAAKRPARVRRPAKGARHHGARLVRQRGIEHPPRASRRFRARGRENGRKHFQHDELARDDLRKLRGDGVAPRQRPGVRGCRRRHGKTERGSRDDAGVLHGAVADSGSVDLRRELREAPRPPSQLLLAAAGADSVRRAERSRLADRAEPRHVEQGAEHRSRDGSEHAPASRVSSSGNCRPFGVWASNSRSRRSGWTPVTWRLKTTELTRGRDSHGLEGRSGQLAPHEATCY